MISPPILVDSRKTARKGEHESNHNIHEGFEFFDPKLIE
jgi:hypothetical protein